MERIQITYVDKKDKDTWRATNHAALAAYARYNIVLQHSNSVTKATSKKRIKIALILNSTQSNSDYKVLEQLVANCYYRYFLYQKQSQLEKAIDSASSTTDLSILTSILKDKVKYSLFENEVTISIICIDLLKAHRHSALQDAIMLARLAPLSKHEKHNLILQLNGKNPYLVKIHKLSTQAKQLHKSINHDVTMMLEPDKIVYIPKKHSQKDVKEQINKALVYAQKAGADKPFKNTKRKTAKIINPIVKQSHDNFIALLPKIGYYSYYLKIDAKYLQACLHKWLGYADINPVYIKKCNRLQKRIRKNKISNEICLHELILICKKIYTNNKDYIHTMEKLINIILPYPRVDRKIALNVLSGKAPFQNLKKEDN